MTVRKVALQSHHKSFACKLHEAAKACSLTDFFPQCLRVQVKGSLGKYRKIAFSQTVSLGGAF